MDYLLVSLANSSSSAVQVGCLTYTQLFATHPVLDSFSEYDSLEVEGVCIGEALRSHAIAIGQVVQVGQIDQPTFQVPT